jgi:hypothetical protein
LLVNDPLRLSQLDTLIPSTTHRNSEQDWPSSFDSFEIS